MSRSWQEYLRDIEGAEREALRRGTASVMEMMDAAWEDPQGRLPHEAGFGTGGQVVELPAREPEPEPERRIVVGDIFAALRELGRRAGG